MELPLWVAACDTGAGARPGRSLMLSGSGPSSRSDRGPFLSRLWTSSEATLSASPTVWGPDGLEEYQGV